MPGSSPAIRRAVIDIRTNSVKVLVAEFAGADIRPVEEYSKQTRLGRGFYETHLLQQDAIAATVEAVENFFDLSRKLGATNIRVFATSATRDARNAADLVDAIQARTGLRVEIISGEQEANWVFEGVSSDPRFAEGSLLILDVGGGSTEFILGKGKQQYFRNSYRLGTVRLLEQIKPGDLPGTEALKRCRMWLENFLTDQIDPALRLALKSSEAHVQLVGTGGTTTILARMENRSVEFHREQIESTVLSLDQVRSRVERLWHLPLEERKQIIGLPPNRADVILTGAAIFEAVMRHYEFSKLQISTRGLRFAAIAE